MSLALFLVNVVAAFCVSMPSSPFPWVWFFVRTLPDESLKMRIPSAVLPVAVFFRSRLSFDSSVTKMPSLGLLAAEFFREHVV